MALPNCSYGTSCGSKITHPHRGICPQGWHIPSNGDWDELTDYVGSYAGTKLKSASGWEPYSGVPAGTDEFGFSALPGGVGSSDGFFLNAGYGGLWWSTSESYSSSAYSKRMGYGYERVYWYNYSKKSLFSVRCLKD
jgi:uncharacterized protein (TIGR02145 family)